MPSYVPFHSIPMSVTMDIPYKKATIVDEFLDEAHGE